MRAVIITPAYGDACHHLYLALMQCGLPFIVLPNRSDQTRARGHLLTHALESGAERIVMIDADMTPSVEQIHALAYSALVRPDLAVTGLYPLKDRRAWAYDEERNLAGLGFCCVHGESLRRLADALPWVEGEEKRWKPFTMPVMLGNTYLGNDFSFWQRLRETGTRLTVDRELRVGHRNAHTFSEPAP